MRFPTCLSTILAAFTAFFFTIVWEVTTAQAGVGYVRVQYLGNQKAKIEAYSCALFGGGANFTSNIDTRTIVEFDGPGRKDFVINDGCGGKWTKARVSVWTGGKQGGYRVVQDNIQFEATDTNAAVYITGPFADNRAVSSNWFSPYTLANLAQGQLATRVANTKTVTVYNRTTSTASCPNSTDCGRAGPPLWVDIHNCSEHTRSNAIPGRTGQLNLTATDTCGEWGQLRIYADYFGVRDLCGAPIDSSKQSVVYVYGPYERNWTDSAGVFECRKDDSPGSGQLVKNGAVKVYNASSLPTWYNYSPNGCNRGVGWLGLGGQRNIGLAGGASTGLFYTIYNHDCKEYSAFWMTYNNDFSWCAPRGIRGNKVFLRYGGYQPGWCEVHDQNFDGF